jgi:hypothetical protein
MKSLFVLLAFLLSISTANAAVEYPDVPLTDSAYRDLYLLIPKLADELGTSHALTNYEFALIIARYSGARIDGKSTLQLVNPDKIRSPITSQQAQALQRLIQKFQPEFKALSISFVSPPFPDVHKSHWAFQAVEKLQQAGIIVGYPEIIEK